MRFEDMCSDYVAMNYPCVKIGRCWGNFINLDTGWKFSNFLVIPAP